MNYQNPVIRGFNPDPSICRVGEDYYLVTSSFEYFPGIPVYHSRDLVNWEQIGNCLQETEGFPFMEVADSGGVWAPTIRYEDGIFYVTATFDACGNFIVRTKDPAGQWSGPVWVSVGGIDPSLYFENGRAYYCTNQSMHPGREEISLYEIDPDSGAVIGEGKAVWAGTGGGHLEAPHIYHIGEWYYLLTAEGGTNFNHMVTVARSVSLWGPYEGCPGNPVLTNVHDTVKQVLCTGHGDLCRDHRGNWWMVHLAVRPARRTMSHLGRETFLVPVTWKDGWPVTGDNRKSALTCDGPLWAVQQTGSVLAADFESAHWEPWWLFLRNPQKGAYERVDGELRLHPSRVHLSDGKNPVFAAVRQADFDCELDAVFDFVPGVEGDEAGLAIVLSSQFYCLFVKKKTADGVFLVLERHAEDLYQRACQIPVPDGRLHLKIRCDKEKYHFSYSVDGTACSEAAEASTRFLACEVSGRCFTGTVIGLYTASDHETGAVMRVKDFGIRTADGTAPVVAGKTDMKKTEGK